MSHKTGKRVLATTATSALAFAGLIAMPLSAQAAAGDNHLSITSQCGMTDKLVLKPGALGDYKVYNGAGTQVGTVDTTNHVLRAGTVSTSGTATGTLTAGTGIVFTDGATTVATWDENATLVADGAAEFTPRGGEPAGLDSATDVYYRAAKQLDTVTISESSDSGATYTDIEYGVLTGGDAGKLSADASTVYDPAFTVTVGSAATSGNNGDYAVSYLKNNAGTIEVWGKLTGGLNSGNDLALGTLSSAGTLTSAASTSLDGGTASIKGAGRAKASSVTAGTEVAGLYVDGTRQSGSTFTKSYTSGSSSTGSDVAMTGVGSPVTSYEVTLPASWYDTTKANSPIQSGMYITDKDGTRLTGIFSDVDGATCETSAVVPQPVVNVTQRTITITKGTGFDWYVTADVTGSTLADAKDQNGAPIGTARTKVTWAAGASDSATAVVKTSSTITNVKVEAVPAPGYTGGSWVRTYKMDGLTTQHTWVPPVVNDVNGQANDTFTVRNYNGVKYYYTTSSSRAAADTTQAQVGDHKATRVDDPTDNVSNAWVEIVPSSGPTTTVNRPRQIGSLTDYYSPVYVLALATAPSGSTAGYGWSDTANLHKQATLNFTNRTVISSVPAPVLVDGIGAEDYYVLTAAEGVTWEVKDGNGNVRDTFTTNDPRYGTQVRVITTPGKTETWTFTAKPVDAAHEFQSGLKTVWTGDFDNRPGITPAAPKFYDNTGLLNDQVEFPALVAGIDYYEFALSIGTASPPAYKQIDGSWYGKQVPLPELQRYWAAINGAAVDYQPTHVWIKAKNNVYVADLAKDADGNTVKADWNYEFKNAFTVVAEPPIQDDRPGTANDTLTFPNETRVVYKVTDEHGSTKTIGLADLGKPLHYTGIVKVAVEAAAGYQLQPNTDGSPFAGWTFEFDDALSEPITPGRPHSHDQAGTDQDTYEIPNQPGVLWTADGVNVDPSTHGQRISTGGKTEITFVARPAAGYSFVQGAETSFTLHWNDDDKLSAPEVGYSLLTSGWQAKASWDAPEDAEGDVTYDVSFAKVSEDENGDEVVGPRTTWFEGTDLTEAQLNAGFNTKYRVYVTATDENGTESEEGTTDIVYATDNRGAEANWTDINRSTVTPSGNDALGWYQAGSSLYFNNTAFVTYRDQSNITFTVNGGQQLRVYGTQYTKGGRALIQVNGTNWAWIDAGASSNADPYKKMLRQINLPNTGTHTIKIIASLLPGKELALDAYEVVR